MIRLFAFYGSKVKIGKKYPKPQYNKIIEPFAGACGYSCHYPELKVELYEKDEIIYSVLSYLIKSSSEEIMNLPLIEPGKTVHDYNLSQEQKWTIGFWVNSAVSSPCTMLSKWGRENWPNVPTNFWGPKCRERLSNHVNKIKHWKVYNKSYENVPNEECTWFIDPPYQNAGKYYRYKNIDYNHLSEWCKSRKGQIIVCENEGANWLPFELFLDNHVGAAKSGSKRKKSKEVIWYKK